MTDVAKTAKKVEELELRDLYIASYLLSKDGIELVGVERKDEARDRVYFVIRNVGCKNTFSELITAFHNDLELAWVSPRIFSDRIKNLKQIVHSNLTYNKKEKS